MTNDQSFGKTLKIGVQLPEVEWETHWSDLKHMSLTAERVGFDSIWLGDHLLYRKPGEPARGPWEVWSMLSAIAAVTERVELGPLVASTSFHSPAMLAKKAVTVDEISGGRLILGLGAGWNKTEYAGFGFPYDYRISRFEEAFDIIRRLVRHEAVSFHGKYYHIEDCEIHPKGPRPEGPPLMVGSVGPRMLSITFPHVSYWNAWFESFGNRPEGLEPIMGQLDDALREADREPHEIVRTVALLVQCPGASGRSVGDDAHATSAPISGNPAEIADQLRAFARLGIAHVQLVLDPINAESIEWCGEVVRELRR